MRVCVYPIWTLLNTMSCLQSVFSSLSIDVLIVCCLRTYPILLAIFFKVLYNLIFVDSFSLSPSLSLSLYIYIFFF